jgi:acetyl-CoA carboxylase biotin carboxyl carrier protein
MPEPTDGNGSTAAALSRFISDRVAPLAKAFASTPLAELRVRTNEGSIRLVKAVEAPTHPRSALPKAALRGFKHQLFPTVESGHPYDVISADVVGIFTPARDVPQPGERIAEDAVLGYIEALKLQHPVRSGGAGVLIAQVAEEGQAVDFGEPLFVVDREAASRPAAAEAAPEALEPPRL